MPRPKSDKTYLRELLDADMLLPADQRMSNAKRAELTLALIECTKRLSRLGKGANKSRIHKVPARTPRSVSPEFEARLRGTDNVSTPSRAPETLGEFLTEENKDAAK